MQRFEILGADFQGWRAVCVRHVQQTTWLLSQEMLRSRFPRPEAQWLQPSNV